MEPRTPSSGAAREARNETARQRRIAVKERPFRAASATKNNKGFSPRGHKLLGNQNAHQG